jgi:uncharacterized YccA/Bax inhibitor family protein
MTLANGLLYTSILAIIAGVASYDWRAGLIVGGVILGVAGVIISMR